MPSLRKLVVCSRNKRALSPIFATVLLASIILIFGSVAYYYSSNLTTATTDNYVSSVANSQQSISEQIGFESVIYNDQSSPATLTVSIVNSGSGNNVEISTVFLYDASHNIAGGSPYFGSSISALYPINGGVPTPSAIASLNVGQEAYFNLTMTGPSLISGSIYTIHLITQSGSYFDYEFAP